MPLGPRLPRKPSYKYTTHKFLPHKSGVHRLACLSLYRHLLRQIPHTPLSSQLLKTILHAEFHADASLRIHADIRQSLVTGYKALSLLSSLHNVAPTSSQILSLSQTLESLLPPPAPIQPTIEKPPPPRLTPYPGGNKILDRPLPASALSGRRHVPKLINAGGLPMLRVKKPQPPLISKIIRDKLAQRQKRLDCMEVMQSEGLVWAEEEDGWEGLVGGLRRREEGSVDGLKREEGKYGDGIDGGEGRYADTVREGIRHVSRLMAEETARQADLAKRFWEIVLREQELADGEREERKRKKVERWIAAARRGVERRGLVWEDRSVNRATNIDVAK